ncbi:MAG: hypothetical protein NZ606_08115 [Candidatus Kapabacteria bacterium]|nr:hypothetical protein [Candidatus Kapabacteria bacterium]
MTLSTIFDVIPHLHTQHFIENRGQWDRRIVAVSASGTVVVERDGLLYKTGERWRRIPLDFDTTIGLSAAAAAVNYYFPHRSAEGVRMFTALVLQRQGRPVVTLSWQGTQLTIHAEDTQLQQALDTHREHFPPFGALRSSGTAEITAWGIGGRFVGSSGRDSIAAMAIADGSVFVCGWTDSPSFPGASGTSSGGRDAFVAKVTPDGTLQWATLIGGTSDDVAYSLSVRSDLVAIAGMTRSTNFPTTAGVVQATYGGGDADGFAVLLNPSTGTRQAATYIGGDGSDAMRAVALGSQRLAIGGSTTSAALPATAHQQQFGGVQDGYITVLNTQLSNRIWSSYYGGRGFDDIRGCGWLSDGSLVIAGITNSPNTAQAIATGLGEGSQRMAPPDGFLARLDANGQRLWGRYYGSDGQDSITHLSISPRGDILVTGFTNGTNTAQSFIADAQAAQNNFAGGESDGFIAVLRPDGTRQWGSYYGGSGADRCTGAAMDAQGYVLVTGWTTSTDLELRHSDNSALAGAEDIMVGFFSPDGTRRIASLLYGGSGSDLPVGIGFLPDSSLAVVGTTTSTSFPPLSGNNAGAMDGFFLRLQSLGILSASPSVSSALPAITTAGSQLRIISPQECIGATVHVYLLHGVLVAHHTLDHEETVFCLPPGVYAVTLQCPSGAVLRQLVLLR